MRIGLAVSSDSVRLVATEGGRILWAGESPIDGDTPLESAATKLLGAVPVRGWLRPRVVAAIGPAQAQLKRLTGLPPVADARVLAKLVQESPGRFFLRNGIPLAMTGVRLAGDGDAWGGALDEPVVSTIADVCRRHRVSLRGVVPTVLVLGNAFEDAHIVWRDGAVIAELSLVGGALDGVRRLPMGREQEVGTPVPRAVLAALGDEAWRFADAYAAAMTRDDEPVAARPGRAAAHEVPRIPRWRLTVAASAVMIATLGLALAPGLNAMRTARHAEQALRALGPARAASVRAESELRRVNATLGEVDAFRSTRRSATAFLAQLADALPPTAQLVTVRLDSVGGTLVVLAPRAGDALSRIERMDTIEAPAIVGPVTREYIGPAEKERVTITFRWRRTRT